MRRRIEKLIFFFCLLAVWQVIYKMKIWSPFLFPSPFEVFDALRLGFGDRTFLIGVGISMRRIAIGYGISIVLGLALGLLIAMNDFLENTIGSLVLSLQSLPSICWLPLALLWFGLSEAAILFVVVMGSLLAVTINTESGVRNVPKIYMLAGRNLGANGARLFLHVLLPASLPYLISGLKQGWAFAWRSLIAGEMIYGSLGLGFLLMMGRDLNDMSQVLAVMGLIMFLGYVVDRVFFVNVERHIRSRWGFAPTS
ncbi:MAG: ABC transporter permease [Acidobacteria bacterium]|nr:ABC transporter permease [Acidobacteriota bacterium]MCL5288217.1 ABC transporter permease [Acidobacteriota bacterium]